MGGLLPTGLLGTHDVLHRREREDGKLRGPDSLSLVDFVHDSPLVLMHGGPGLDHTTLSALEPLADSFKLIFYDHRCNGRSTEAVESMTWDNLTADADALRERLGFDEWAVLGPSFGGNVALEYALRYPGRLSQLLLLDTCGDAWWIQQNAPEMLRKRGYRAATVQAARRFYNGQLTPGQVRPTAMRFLGAYFYHFSALALPHALRSTFHMKMRPEAHVFGFSRLQTGWTVMSRLNEIRAPTLVLAGRHDLLFPPGAAPALQDPWRVWRRFAFVQELIVRKYLGDQSQALCLFGGDDSSAEHELERSGTAITMRVELRGTQYCVAREVNRKGR